MARIPSYFVIGHPLGHSLSPQIHRRLFQLEGMEADYLLDDFPPQELEAAYRRKLEALPENWRAARDLAQAHGDMARAAVEEWKLEAWQQAWDQLGKEA